MAGAEPFGSDVKEKRETAVLGSVETLLCSVRTGMQTEGQQGLLGPVLLKTTLKTFFSCFLGSRAFIFRASQN